MLCVVVFENGFEQHIVVPNKQTKIKTDTTTIHNNRNSYFVALVEDYYGEVNFSYSIQIWKPKVKRNMLDNVVENVDL